MPSHRICDCWTSWPTAEPLSLASSRDVRVDGLMGTERRYPIPSRSRLVRPTSIPRANRAPAECTVAEVEVGVSSISEWTV